MTLVHAGNVDRVHHTENTHNWNYPSLKVYLKQFTDENMNKFLKPNNYLIISNSYPDLKQSNSFY